MKEEIVEYINQIEKDRNVTVLLACETGSRAWGFPSPDSDYDIRLVYTHKPSWYLTLEEGKDSIEMMLEDNELDISGWELRKSLRLLWKSNPPLLERIQSPIIYKSDKVFVSEISEIASKCYSRIASIHHYLSMAKKCLAEVSQSDTYKLKKLFYALRTAVACKWILVKNEMPPIEFPMMLDGLSIDSGIKSRISELIALKSTCNEDYLHTGDKEILVFIKDCITESELESKSLPPSKGDMDDLNQLLRKYVAQS